MSQSTQTYFFTPELTPAPSIQVMRPDGDIADTGWTPTPGSPTTLWDKLDEVTASDADFISATAT